MIFKYKQFFILALVLVFMSLACSLGKVPVEQDTSPEASASEQSVAQNDQVQTEEPIGETAQPPSTPPPAEVPPVPSLSQEELLDKWRPPIGVYVFLKASCDGVQETLSQQLDGEESSSAELVGEVFGIQLILGLTESFFSEWEATQDQQTLKEDGQASLASIQDLVEKWSNGELAAEEASNQLAAECESIDKKTEDIALQAKAEGLSEESLESIFTDIQKSFEEGEQASKEEAAQSISEEVGRSRKNPYPRGEVGSAPNWDIQVLESSRGEEAWQMIQAVNSYNEPAPEGKEYLLVKIHVLNTAAEDEERSINSYDFGLTGSHNVLYSQASVVGPDPALGTQLFPGGEAEGWITFVVYQDESNLIIILNELANWDEDRFRFYAVDEGASISIPEDIISIQPTDLGLERAEPAPYGDAIVTEDWEIRVLDVVRGEDAWQMILEANQYNDPPGEGFEYVLAKIHARYIGVSAASETIDKLSFKTTGSGNVLNDAASVVEPDPTLTTSLFPGGIAEGWIPLQAVKEESGLMLVFQPWADWDDAGRRYLSLEK